MSSIMCLKAQTLKHFLLDIRARLLDPSENAELHYALSSLLLLLPQTEAYLALHRRLSALPPASVQVFLKNSFNEDLSFNRLSR